MVSERWERRGRGLPPSPTRRTDAEGITIRKHYQKEHKEGKRAAGNKAARTSGIVLLREKLLPSAERQGH